MSGLKYFSEPLRFIRERPLLCVVCVGSIIVPAVSLYRRYCREHALSTESLDGVGANNDFENVRRIEGMDCEKLLPEFSPLSGPVVPYMPVWCPAPSPKPVLQLTNAGTLLLAELTALDELAISPRFELMVSRDGSTGQPAPLAVLHRGHGRRGRPLTSSKGCQTHRRAVIKMADMSEDMQQDAVVCAIQAMEKHKEDREVAAYVKKEFDRKYGSRWQCVVGRSYGSYVTHETKHFIYFHLGQKAILLFKYG